MDGKNARMRRILEKGKAVIVPMDHGTSDGPMEGLEDMNKIVFQVAAGGASAVLLHKGIIRSLREAPGCGVIMHASAGTKLSLDPLEKVTVANVHEALRLGADAVSVHVNVGGSAQECAMLQALANTAEECDALGMPLLAMMYPRGKNVTNGLDPEMIAHVARIGAELGADIVKCLYSGDSRSFEKVVRGCPVPIVIAGGPKCKNDEEVLQMVRGAMDAGAIGVSLGRNIFQHADPKGMTRALRAVIVENAGVEEAKKELKK